MGRGRVGRFAGVMVALVLACGANAGAAEVMIPARIVGTAGVNVRACPDLGCDVLTVARLGDQVTVTGEANDGFVPVSMNGLAGYAYGLYVAEPGRPVPSLTLGGAGCNRVALIFNVGIGSEPDAGILDTLEEARVPATMFVMGWWAADHPDFLGRMIRDGFVIGSHGDQPQELTDRSDAEVAADIRAAADAITSASGSPPGPWFTPYAAAIDDRVRAVVAGLGYLPVGWTVPADDYGPDATASEVADNVLGNVTDGAIVELHLDGPASATSTGVALPHIIDELRAEGYRLVTIPELAEPCG